MIKKNKYNPWEPCYIYKERRFRKDTELGKGDYLIVNQGAERRREYTPYGGYYAIRVKNKDGGYFYCDDLD